MTIQVSLEELVKAGAHFGHQSRRWNPKMGQYIYAVKDGVHVFNLEETKRLIIEACEFLKEASKNGKKIIFLGTKKQAKQLVTEIAKETNSYYVNERWLGGTLTNFDQIKKSTSKLTDLKEKLASGFYANYTKKERLLLDREVQRLERFFGGLVGIDKTPEVLVIIDVKREIGAAKEAKAKGIDTIALVDSNSDPTVVDYPIPMNDDATKAIAYVLGLMKEAILEGRKVTGTQSTVVKKIVKKEKKEKTEEIKKSKIKEQKK